MTRRFSEKTALLIQHVQDTIKLYKENKHKPSLLNIYRTLVNKNILTDTPDNYRLLVKTVSKAREAGFIKWDAIEGRRQVGKHDIQL